MVLILTSGRSGVHDWAPHRRLILRYHFGNFVH